MKALQSEGELLRALKDGLRSASEFRLGLALVTKGGLDLIRPSIERCLQKGGDGYVLFGVDLPTQPAAIDDLCAIQARYRQNFHLQRFQSGRMFFHPKFSMFIRRGKKTAIIGSSNLTAAGLNGNLEANVFG